MSRATSANLILGGAVIAFALILIFVWVPLDTVSGIMGVLRRRPFIGDAMAPTVAGLFLLIGGFLVMVFERRPERQPTIDSAQIRFVLWIAACLAIGLLMMRYGGPLAVAAWSGLSGQELSYRPLRATVPWKYIGFVLGCSFSVTAISAMTEGRLRARHILAGIGASALMVLVFDGPFEDLLLPPNGDL